MLGDSILYLDPTSKYSSLQEINYGIQGKECIIEDGDNYLLRYLPATSYSENLSQYSDSISISGKRMHIRGEHILGGILKSGFQELSSELGGSNLERLNEYYITGGDNNISIINYTVEGIQEKVEQIRYTYELESPEGIIMNVP